MTLEDNIRRLIASTERLHETAAGVARWAEQHAQLELPAPLQAVIDAAADWERNLEQYSAAADDTQPETEETTSPEPSDTKDSSD